MIDVFRLNSIVYRLERVCNKDYKYGEMLIKKDTVIQIPVYPIHHDPEIFPDPETYNPERHLPGNVTYQSTHFMPFGVGPRMCIGMRFAYEESKIGLAELVSKFQFDISEKNPELEPKPGSVFLSSFDNFTLKLTERSKIQ